MAVDYNAIAAKHIRKPLAKPPRILVYGRNKKGKTYLCASAPDVLIIDPEDGTSFTPDRDGIDVWPVEKWTDLNEVYQALSHGLKSPITGRPYRWVALDGCTRFANMALRYTLMSAAKYSEERDLNTKEGAIRIQDYGQAGEMFKGMVLNFHTLPQGLIFTAQERVEENTDVVDEADDDEGTPSAFRVADVPRGCRAPLNAVVDVIGRIYTQKVEETYRAKTKTGEIVDRERSVIQRRLWVSPHESYDTGYRAYTPNVPDYFINPTVETIQATLRKAK